jgi:protease II
VEHVIHGDRRVDYYAWMRDRKDPRVSEYLEAENAYADAEMKTTEGFQEKLYQEMLGRILQTDLSVPYRLRGYLYYTRTQEGKQYAIYCRRKDSSEVELGENRTDEHEATGKQEEEATSDQRPATGSQEESSQLSVISSQFRRRETQEAQAGPEDRADLGRSPSQLRVNGAAPLQGEEREEVLLDLNELAAGHAYMGLGLFEVSDDNQWLAYATDTTGYRQYVLEVKDLRNGGLLPFRAERVTSAAWAMDNRTLFYVTEDEVTKRSNQLWRHEFSSQLSVISSQFRRRETQEAEPGSEERADMACSPSQLRVNSAAPLQEISSQLSVISSQSRRRETQEAQPGSEDRTDLGRSPSQFWVNGAAPLRGGADELLYEEKDERFRIDVERSRSGAYLFLVSNSHTTSEVRYLRADSPFSGLQLVAEREDDHEYYLDHHPGSASDEAGGIFFIRTNSGGRTYRLVTAPTEDPVKSRWHEVIANRPGVMLAGLSAFRTHLVLTEREDGLPHLRIVDLMRQAPTALAASRRIEFAEPAYNAALGANPEFESEQVRFQYESLVTPRSVYDYDVRTGERILRKRQPVLGDFDTANYVSERLHAKAKDGTLIPVSVVRRKDTLRDGNAPLLLYGYGSYGLSLPVTFSSNRLSLLDRGMVYAIAHIRGGGELGKPWHDAGRLHHKMNTFTDFIACADYLVAKRYTSPERLVIEGGSAGGLLMGAVTNLRPELFHVVVSHVPFVDVLNTMLDPSLPLTVGEYEEWGNPQVEEDYFYMKQYCPYTNVERKAYPRMLVETAWNDSQVMYWEAAKYVAKLRAMKTDGNVLLLKTNMGAGHGGASGRYDFLREIAFDYAFMLRELGIGE